MNQQQRYKKLVAGLVALVGLTAVSAHASTNTSLSISLDKPGKIQDVMTLADSLGFDYVIRPKLDSNGEFEAGVVEINIEDQVSYAALRRMLAN